MDKLQYDSFHKFLVSLGLVLVVLPFAALLYFLNVEPLIISQIEYDALSEYTLQMINNQYEILTDVIKLLPNVGCGSFLFGCILIWIGATNWEHNQHKLDEKLSYETTMQALALMGMSSNEVNAKAAKEVMQATKKTENNDNNAELPSMKSSMDQYKNIEKNCFDYFSKKYGNAYSFKSNIRMGRHEYDLIGVSKKNDNDLIVEIKYWKNPGLVARGLIDTYAQLNSACENYQTIAHRDNSGLLVIVAPDEDIEKIENMVNRYQTKALQAISENIQIQCLGESIIK